MRSGGVVNFDTGFGVHFFFQKLNILKFDTWFGVHFFQILKFDTWFGVLFFFKL